jgi:hypothetical protein
LIEIQPVPELAVHEQSRSVETETDPVPPLALNAADVALNVALHLMPSGAATEVRVLVEQPNEQPVANVRKSAADDLPIGSARDPTMHTAGQRADDRGDSTSPSFSASLE